MNNQPPKYPDRLHPSHYPAVEKHNRPNIFFITVCSKDKKKIFARREIHDLLTATWKEADYWLVGRYIIMPDHIHLFCACANYKFPDLKSWVTYWKAIVSKKWPYPEEKPLWQQDFWDRQLRSVDHYSRKWDYVRRNPVNHGYVKHPDEWSYQGELNGIDW